jgi:coproporphyrinogen III oxidase-like Fe-S oxidoreductase
MLWIRSCELNLSVLLMQVTCTVSVTEVMLTSVLKAETISYDTGFRYRGVMSRLLAPPLSLYVHFPWCVRKCPYCDFNSYTLNGELPHRPYLQRLTRDLEAQAPQVAGREVHSIFLGGGTPSLFAPQAIGELLTAARAQLTLADHLEVTLEANPGAIERGAFREYRAAGVTRVSLGAQSFDQERLTALGRIHSPAETRLAAAELHAAGTGPARRGA